MVTSCAVDDRAPGGTVPARLFSLAFFSDVAELMSADGVLVLNYFGRADANLRALACALQAADFKHLRLFREAAQIGNLSCCVQAACGAICKKSVAPLHIVHICVCVYKHGNPVMSHTA